MGLGVGADRGSGPAAPSSALAVSTTFSSCEELSKAGHACDVGTFDAGLRTILIEDKSKFTSGCCRCGAHHHVKKGKCVPCDAGFYNRAGDDPSGADTKCRFSAHRMRQEWTKDTYPPYDKRHRPPDEYLMKPVGTISQLQDKNPETASQADQLKKEIAYWRENFGAAVKQDSAALTKVLPLRVEDAKEQDLMDAWNSVPFEAENRSAPLVKAVALNRTALADELTPYFLPAMPAGVGGALTARQVEVTRNRTALVLATEAAIDGEDDDAALNASRALVQSDAVIHGEDAITHNENALEEDKQSSYKLYTPQADVLCKEYQRLKAVQDSIVEEFKEIRANETRLFNVYEVDATEAERITRESTEATIEAAVARQLLESCHARTKGEQWALSEERFEEEVETGEANAAQQEVDFMGPNQFKSANNFRRANSASNALKSAKTAIEKTKAEEKQSQADIALLNQTCDKLSLASDARQGTMRTLNKRETELYQQELEEKTQLGDVQTYLLRATMKLWRTHTKMEEIELVLANMHAKQSCPMGSFDEDWSVLFEGEEGVIPPEGASDEMLANFAQEFRGSQGLP